MIKDITIMDHLTLFIKIIALKISLKILQQCLLENKLKLTVDTIDFICFIVLDINVTL